MLSSLHHLFMGTRPKIKKKYLNASNKLGDAIMNNTTYSTIIGANAGGLIASDNIIIKGILGLLLLFCIVMKSRTQKLIELNTPSKNNQATTKNDAATS